MSNSSKLLSRTRNVALALAITAVLAACGGGGGGGRNNQPPAAAVGDTFAVTTTGRLLNFSRTTGGVQTSTQITGLGTDTVIGFDVRPADNTLIVVGQTGTTGRIYRVDPASGAATMLSTINVATVPVVLTGTSFGADFNPVPDRLRLVSNTGQNLRINVMTGAATVDGTLTLRNGPAATGVTEVGYTNDFANACRTQLFYLDTTNNRLLTTNDPNNGVVTTVGSFGVQTNAAPSSFEIFTSATGANTAAVVLTVGGRPTVYSLDITTGVVSGAAMIAGLNPGENLLGIAAMTPTAAITQNPGAVVGVTASNRIYTFEAAGPTKVCTGPTAITGLAANTTILGADFRPSNNQLYVVGRVGTTGTNGTLYVVDPVTGAVSTAMGLAAATINGATLDGAAYGVDFNPSNDMLRVVSNAGQNLSVNPNATAGAVLATAQTTINTAVMGAPTPALAGAGYTNSIGPLAPASTTLYTIDGANGNLNIQNPAASGTQTTIGSLGLPANTVIREFDVLGSNNTALLGTQTAGAATTTLFTVQLVAVPATATVAAIPAGTTVSQGVLGSGNSTPVGEAVTAISIRPPQQTLFGVTAANNLVTFSSDPTTIGNAFPTSVAITGLQGTERLIGIDFRPADNRLYAATDAGRVYIVNTTTGALTATAPFTPNPAPVAMETPFAAALLLPGNAANQFGVDFNPMADRLRTVASDNPVTDLRTVIESGVTFVDGMLRKVGTAPTVLNVTSAAYSGSSPGAPAPTATTLYVLDATNDRLFIQNPPNNGILNPTVGTLGIDATVIGGFDIVGRQTGLAALSTATAANQLYSVNLGTGAVTVVGTIGTGLNNVTGLAITPSATDPAAGVGVPVMAILDGITLATFLSTTPGTVGTIGAITGMQTGELIRDIDFRPATGVLYAFTNQGRVYTIDTVGAGATPAPALVAGAPAATGGAFGMLMGTNFGIDFNPVPDRLRIVSDAGQSLRIDVTTGNTFQDTSLTATAPVTLGATAYTNNFAGTQSTVLLQLDTNSGTLEAQDPMPNLGMLTQRGRLDPVLTFTKVAGFDIQGADNGGGIPGGALTTAPGAVALAVLQTTNATQSVLYRVNLAGNTVTPAVPFALTPIGAVGPAVNPVLITAFAIRLQ